MRLWTLGRKEAGDVAGDGRVSEEGEGVIGMQSEIWVCLVCILRVCM